MRIFFFIHFFRVPVVLYLRPISFLNFLMKQLKYYFLLVLIILIIVAFSFQTKSKKALSETETIDEIQKLPEINYALEIKEALNSYDSLLTTDIRESGTIGAAVVIVYKNQIAFLKCYGVRQVGTSDSINKNTVFRLASVSKSITGVLAGILDEENTIGLDEKVVDIIPGFRLKDDNSTKEITVRNLLSHTSGLIPHAYDNLIEEHVPFHNIMTRLKDVEISAPPGQIYGYQNVVFSLYDTIVVSKTAKSFAEIINEKVFTPFGMNDASVGFEAFEANTNKAIPHTGSNGYYRSSKLNDRYYSTAPAAGINASITDLAQFMMNVLNKDSSIVDNQIRETVFTPQVISPLNRRYFLHWTNVKSKQYAIGWRVVEYKNRDVAYHGGYVRGYRAEIALCFDENVGIAFLSNSPGPIGTKTVPSFLDLFFELKDNGNLKTLAP